MLFRSANIIEEAMDRYNFIAKPDVIDYFETDKEARRELSSLYLK